MNALINEFKKFEDRVNAEDKNETNPARTQNCICAECLKEEREIQILIPKLSVMETEEE